MTTKLLLVFMAILAGVFLGLALSNRSASRRRYFEELIALTERIISDIRFSQRRIENILGESSCQNAHLQKNILEYTAFIKGAPLALSKGVLNKRELGLIEEFFLRLGTLDLDTQIGELEAQREVFRQISAEAKEKDKKFGRAYIKLGFLAGLLIGVLLL